MDISFTGIKNLYIGKKTYSQFGNYLGMGNRIKQGNKNYTVIKVKCELTDDCDGSHLSDFYNALKACGLKYKKKDYLNQNKPELVEFLLTRFDVKDDRLKISSSNFKLNNQDISLTHRWQLPLYTYMAKLTRQIYDLADVSDARKSCAKLFNRSVHKTAVDFIENME